ncbi:SIMPL domain-containing protein [Streptomyces sp. B1866]|uniref:SIMPL domain-containing protein n=1 Tax=Streptomyces sp. B1866 TaxID=3075431 RepID=UPI00288D0598|nr:SIMPL domain-containing protein [Streptomyces sp. B1866]MDT3399104.1 SIMPL domain-containing protein [Streptomyces sp. B1866]
MADQPRHQPPYPPQTPETTPDRAAAPPYGTPDAPRVAVRGEARLEVEPEIARIAVTVGARGTDRRATLEDLTRRNARALDLVRSYGEAVEKLETGSFSLTPQLTEKGRHERVHAYHGSVHTAATLADFTALGELATRLAGLDLTSVAGPWWALRPDSPAHGEARRQAVREAVRRAREYADALGARIVALVELADIGAESPEPYSAVRTRSLMAYGAAAESDAPPLDLEPLRQTVYAHVNARFVMTPPAL